MRGFMILCCTMAVALAAPQYSYQQPGSLGGAVGQHAGTVGVQPNYAPSSQQSFASGAQLAPGGFGQASVASPSFAGQNTIPQQAAAPAIYNKHFFIHSAPEDDGLDGSGSSNSLNSLRKNLRVVIVKAPENKGLTNAALQLAKSASEDKTVVYVLNKQTDLGELANQLAQIQENNPNKPEVHFVKYKTPEEAEHAQHTIQSQYDSLGGSTQVSDEGVAPVQNFIGSAGSAGTGGAAGVAGLFGAGSTQSGTFAAQGNFGSVQNTYLPAVRL